MSSPALTVGRSSSVPEAACNGGGLLYCSEPPLLLPFSCGKRGHKEQNWREGSPGHLLGEEAPVLGDKVLGSPHVLLGLEKNTLSCKSRSVPES